MKIFELTNELYLLVKNVVFDKLGIALIIIGIIYVIAKRKEIKERSIIRKDAISIVTLFLVGICLQIIYRFVLI